MSETPPREGRLVATLTRAIDALSKWTSVACGFYDASDFELSPGGAQQAALVARVDRVLVRWWLALALSYPLSYWVPFLRPVILIGVSLRLINILSYALRVSLVPTSRTALEERYEIVSARRSLILSFGNFIELIVGFACVYAAFPSDISLPKGETAAAGTYLYFSTMTQLTVGYGDVAPLSGLRAVAAFQALSGLLLIAIVIARCVGMLRFEEIRAPVQSPSVETKDPDDGGV